MKLVKIKNVDKDVTCSFCKRKNTQKRIQGSNLGARTCCKECWDTNEKIQREKEYESRPDHGLSLGEERAYSIFGLDY